MLGGDLAVGLEPKSPLARRARPATPFRATTPAIVPVSPMPQLEEAPAAAPKPGERVL